MVMSICFRILTLALLSTLAAGHYHYEAPPLLTLGLLDEPYQMDERHVTQVPLLLVPATRLRVVHGDFSYLQPTYYGARRMGVIRLELPQPVLVSRPSTMIDFPATFTVLHDGHPVPFAVSAVLAPVFELGQGPQEIRVVYAVPSYVRPQYAYRPPQAFRPYQPVYSDLSANYATTATRPVVTVLDFPSSVATPGSLFFQPSVDPESELGNREPPQAIVPAGIVQSTAPLPNISLFVNSKESTILQALRDEAQKNRLGGDTDGVVNGVVVSN